MARYRRGMDTTSTPTPSVTEDLPELRDCTRCDGQQHLLISLKGMGKYRCDGCGMIVGFDLDGEPAEFLLDRGQPGRYTRDVFGAQLTGPERRL